MFVFCAIRKMQKIVFSLKLFLFFAINISFTFSQDSRNRMKSSKTFPESPIRDGSSKCTNDVQSNDRGLQRTTTRITLIDIESTDYIHPSNTIFSNKNNNLFFTLECNSIFSRNKHICCRLVKYSLEVYSVLS